MWGRQALPRSRDNCLQVPAYTGCALTLELSRREGPALTFQLTGYAVGGLGHGAGPGRRVAQGAQRRNSCGRARTQEAWGPWPALQPPAPPAAEGTRCFLPGRPQPGSSPPRPPGARRRRRGAESQLSARPVAQELLWQGRQGVGVGWPGGSRVWRTPLAVPSPLLPPRAAVPAGSTRGRCPLGDPCGPPAFVHSKTQLGRWTGGRPGGASIQQGALDLSQNLSQHPGPNLKDLICSSLIWSL